MTVDLGSLFLLVVKHGGVLLPMHDVLSVGYVPETSKEERVKHTLVGDQWHAACLAERVRCVGGQLACELKYRPRRK